MIDVNKSLVSIYRSNRKDEMYLYVLKKEGFARVPALLLEQFGQPAHSMDLLLTEQKKLARADVKKVLADLQEKGFYLQMPSLKEQVLPLQN